MRHLRALLAALAATAIVATVPSPAQAADAWDVPGRAWITIKGHGYGHGHGMSQYGAEGAAREGLGFRAISEFYYPGTEWGRATGRIRVLISADTTDDLVVRTRSGLTLRDAGTGKNTVLPDNGADPLADRAQHRGPGHGHLLHQPLAALPSCSRAKARSTPAARRSPLVTPSGDRPYRGRLWSSAPAPARRPATRSTCSPSRPTSRASCRWRCRRPGLRPRSRRRRSRRAPTRRTSGRTAPEPMCDTTSCQVYGGYAAEHPAPTPPSTPPRRLALIYDGEPAFTQFASSSGGWTSAGSVPYLVAQEDPYDGWSGNRVHTWSTSGSRTASSSAPGPASATSAARRPATATATASGAAGSSSIRIVGGKGRVTISGDTLRSALGLRSTWVNFKVMPRTS